MEDAATAEICRSQVWQWIHLAARLDDGRTVTRSLAREALDTCVARLSMEETPSFGEHRFKEAAAVLEETALSAELPDFLTLAAYRYIE
jgi:malate synthase